MSGRKPVRVTYAHKRRRVLNPSRRLLSSPLEVLPPETVDLSRTEVARRMLKRSRRMALADQFEDSHVENNMREHLAKRIKRTQECASNGESTRLPSEAPPQDDIAFRTPFPPSQPVDEQTVAQPLVQEPLSPVPVAQRVVSCTRSGSLKENGTRPQALASPFNSRPGSAASSPKNKGKGRSTRRVSRSLLANARTLSGAFKENTRQVSRKGSAMSLRGVHKGPTRQTKHQRCPSSPSTAYMRSQFTPEDWIVSSKVLSRAFYDYQEILSPGGVVHSVASFHAEQPQSCSTPAMSQSRKLSELHWQQNGADNPLSSSPISNVSAKANSDVKMMDGTVLPRHRTVHLSQNSISSSSDQFAFGSFPTMNDGGTIVKSSASGRDKAPDYVARQALTHPKAVERPQADHPLVAPFIAEYDAPLSDLLSSPVVAATIKTLDSEDVLGSPVGEQPIDLPGTSSAHRRNLVIRTHGSSNMLTPASSPPKAATSCPSSPASDLVLVFRSMDICGDLDTHSDGETHRPSSFRPLQTCSHSLRDVLALVGSTTNKSIKQMPARSRAGTIRASDFAKHGISSPSNVRRTRSGTVVGPDSKLAAKGSGLPGLAARGAPAPKLAAVHSGSESEDESEDELLLKGAWIEDLEYLGLALPQSRKDAEADEMNLGGLWHSLKLAPSRRLGLKRR